MSASIPPKNGSETEPAETRAIRVMEVLVREYPEEGYEYRGQIRSYDLSGTVLLEQMLHRRHKPEWLGNCRPQGSGDLEFARQWRRHDDESWQDVGRVALRPTSYLVGESSAVAEIPLPGWERAAALRMCVRLSESPA